MSILVDQDTRLLVHGISNGSRKTCIEHLMQSGADITAAVAFGQGGTWVSGVPVFDTVKEAIHATDVNACLICVSADEAMEAILEVVDAEVPLIICLTSGVPVRDVVRVQARLLYGVSQRSLPGSPFGRRRALTAKPIRLIGPGSLGVSSPGKCVASIIPGHISVQGSVGVASRSGSLAFEVTWLLTQAGLGQSTILGIGSGFVAWTPFRDVLEMFEDDPSTEQVVLIGEIGGRGEELAAEFVRERMSKPVVAFVAGQTAPPGRRMGHEGAIIEEYAGTAQQKIDALKDAGVRVARSLTEIPGLLKGA